MSVYKTVINIGNNLVNLLFPLMSIKNIVQNFTT